MMTEPLPLAATPLVTAIVSTYNAERFMQGCLDDLVAQTLFPRMEVIIIDSGSPQNEAAICAPFVQQYPNIHYIRTEREGIYAAWNRGVQMAKGKYLTNANTDDRHSPGALEILVNALEAQPDAVLAYGDQYASATENETFAACESRASAVVTYPEFNVDTLIHRCVTGSQPLWRRQLHEQFGLFNPRITIAGDWDFWLRIAQQGPFIHTHQILGVLYESEHTLSGSNNLDALYQQNLSIQQDHLKKQPWANTALARQKVALDTLGVGYGYLRKNQLKTARQFFIAAWRMDPWNLKLIRTLVLRGILGIRANT